MNARWVPFCVEVPAPANEEVDGTRNRPSPNISTSLHRSINWRPCLLPKKLGGPDIFGSVPLAPKAGWLLRQATHAGVDHFSFFRRKFLGLQLAFKDKVDPTDYVGIRRDAGLLQRLTAFPSWASNCSPLSPRCIQTHGRRFLLARPPFYCLGVVCTIPCDLPYGLRHHVIFGPAQVGRVA
jgi:hypothetical protein